MKDRQTLVESLVNVGKAVLPFAAGPAGVAAAKAVVDLYDNTRDLFDHEPAELAETRAEMEARIAAAVDTTVDKLRG